MASITIRIPEELFCELQKLCAYQHRSASEVVRDSLRRYLAVARFQVLRQKTLPLAEAQGLLTDEGVLGSVS